MNGLFAPIRLFRLILLGLALGLAGCAHQVSFQDVGYSTGAQRTGTGIVVVIDQDTLNRKTSIRSAMTGLAHNWEVEPGQMLKQVADIELPQMFDPYEQVSGDGESRSNGRSLILEMTVPGYDFADFRATITVRAIARAPTGRVLFDKTYTEQGDTQGGKMFWGGAFAMKSAIRQSSLDAYQKIFQALRGDLNNALRSGAA